jgi:hypothetical protein
VAEERMRIARELRDVVAHHLALANAQAGTAAHLQRTHPQQVRKILDDLSGTTASALRELKATVGLLRQADDPDAPLEPSPGLDRLSRTSRPRSRPRDSRSTSPPRARHARCHREWT